MDWFTKLKQNKEFKQEIWVSNFQNFWRRVRVRSRTIILLKAVHRMEWHDHFLPQVKNELCSIVLNTLQLGQKLLCQAIYRKITTYKNWWKTSYCIERSTQSKKRFIEWIHGYWHIYTRLKITSFFSLFSPA